MNCLGQREVVKYFRHILRSLSLILSELNSGERLLATQFHYQFVYSSSFSDDVLSQQASRYAQPFDIDLHVESPY